jgi:hypothetical protein
MAKKRMSKSVRPRVPADMIEPSKEISFGNTIRDMKGKPVPPPPGKSKGMMQTGGTKLYNKKGQYQASGEKKKDNGVLARLSRAGEALADLPGNIVERYQKGVAREKKRSLEAAKWAADPNSSYNNPPGKTKPKSAPTPKPRPVDPNDRVAAAKRAAESEGPIGEAIRSHETAKRQGRNARTQKIADEAAARRGPSREEKQSTRQGASDGKATLDARKATLDARAKGVAGQAADDAKRKAAAAEPKKGTYAYAKKQNPNIDALIKRRKSLTRGTPEYNKIQNQINKAYGKGSTTRDTTPTASLARRDVKSLDSKQPEQKLQISKPAAPSAPASKTSGTLPDRRAAKKTGKETRGNLKDQIKDARKQNRGQKAAKRQGKRVDRLQEKLKKIQSR